MTALAQKKVSQKIACGYFSLMCSQAREMWVFGVLIAVILFIGWILKI